MNIIKNKMAYLKDKLVQLKFTKLDLEEHRNCDYDYVEIYETYENATHNTGFKGR